MAPNLPIREDPPSYQEIKRVVSELRDGRANWVFGIPAELLKGGEIACYNGTGVVHRCCPPWLEQMLGHSIL